MSALKHRLKLALRGLVSRTVYYTGLDRLIGRCAAPRLTILAGHCIEDEEINGGLPADMKIRAQKLEQILRALGRRHQLCTVAEGLAALDAGELGEDAPATELGIGHHIARLPDDGSRGFVAEGQGAARRAGVAGDRAALGRARQETHCLAMGILVVAPAQHALPIALLEAEVVEARLLRTIGLRARARLELGGGGRALHARIMKSPGASGKAEMCSR